MNISNCNFPRNTDLITSHKCSMSCLHSRHFFFKDSLSFLHWLKDYLEFWCWISKYLNIFQVIYYEPNSIIARKYTLYDLNLFKLTATCLIGWHSNCYWESSTHTWTCAPVTQTGPQCCSLALPRVVAVWLFYQLLQGKCCDISLWFILSQRKTYTV